MENIVRIGTHKEKCRRMGSYRKGERERDKTEQNQNVRGLGGEQHSVCYQIWPLSPKLRGMGEGLWVRLTYPASGC